MKFSTSVLIVNTHKIGVVGRNMQRQRPSVARGVGGYGGDGGGGGGGYLYCGTIHFKYSLYQNAGKDEHTHETNTDVEYQASLARISSCLVLNQREGKRLEQKSVEPRHPIPKRATNKQKERKCSKFGRAPGFTTQKNKEGCNTPYKVASVGNQINLINAPPVVPGR